MLTAASIYHGGSYHDGGFMLYVMVSTIYYCYFCHDGFNIEVHSSLIMLYLLLVSTYYGETYQDINGFSLSIRLLVLLLMVEIIHDDENNHVGHNINAFSSG